MRVGVRVPLVTIAVLVGCGDNQLGIERRRPNRPPATLLSSGPPDSVHGTNYRVHFFWTGVDPDGTVDHYDYILVDHPASNDSIAASSPDYARRVVVEIPAVDDPRWRSTFAHDSILVTRADTLRRDPVPPPGLSDTQLGTHNDFVRMQSFERWHSFFVRAVDNQGLPDATPVYRSFNSRTLAPTVGLLRPVLPGHVFQGVRTLVFRWEGADPVGDGTIRSPIASRWVLLRSSPNGIFSHWPRALYELPETAWSPWRPWQASDQSGRRAVLQNLTPIGSDPESEAGYYFFAVQAMDEAGAVTPVFDDALAPSNNATRFYVIDRAGPTLTVRDAYLGTFVFAGGLQPVTLEVAGGQEIRLRWSADAAQYGGEIVAYRYGWDIRDPQDETQWEQNWSATALSAGTRTYPSGTHRFFLQVRDNLESITSATIEFFVHRPTLRRDLLFVDDSHHPQGEQDPDESAESQRWQTVLDQLLLRSSFDWRADRDLFTADISHLPPVPLLFDYKTVVWNQVGSDRNSALRALANFFDPFLASNRGRVPPFNSLSSYLDNGGELWLSGQQTTSLLWPVGRRPLREQPNPVNVTNWDDPQEPHPQEDSVGVNSFLYKMGIEAFVLGAGGGAPAPRMLIEHGCRGFRRGTPGDFLDQEFLSSATVFHTHQLTVPTEDVDTPSDRVYSTTTEAGHEHALSVTAAEFRRLQRGETISFTPVTSEIPQPHTHAFEVVDRVGLWGGPPALQVQESKWAQPVSPIFNPLRVRPNVEILNMPEFLGSQTPPLSPDPGIWLPLYSYVSGVPRDPDAPQAVVYPRTADGQTVAILRRPYAGAARFTRAYCSFEPWRLTLESHVALADFILLRHFRLGLPDHLPELSER